MIKGFKYLKAVLIINNNLLKKEEKIYVTPQQLSKNFH